MADALEALIDKTFTKLLKRVEERDKDGNPIMSSSDLTKALEVAVKWQSAKREQDGGGFGSAFGKERG